MTRTSVQVTNEIPLYTAQLQKNAAARTRYTLQTLQRSIRDQMLFGPKSGVPGPFMRRSAGGEAPAVQTTVLFNSIQVTPVSDVSPIAQGEVFSDDPKAVFLEKGTSKMAPRPFFGPAVAAQAPLIPRNFERIFEAGPTASPALSEVGRRYLGRGTGHGRYRLPVRRA